MRAYGAEKAFPWLTGLLLRIETFCFWFWTYTFFATGTKEIFAIFPAYHARFFCCNVVTSIVGSRYWTIIHIFISFLCFNSDVHIIPIFLPIRIRSFVVLIEPIYLFRLSLSSDIELFIFRIWPCTLNFTNFPLDLFLKQRALLFLDLFLLTQPLQIHFLIEIVHYFISLKFWTHFIYCFS